MYLLVSKDLLSSFLCFVSTDIESSLQLLSLYRGRLCRDPWQLKFSYWEEGDDTSIMESSN